MRTLIKGGYLLTGHGEYPGDVLVEDGAVVAITTNQGRGDSSERHDTDEVIDASGLVVAPGLVDTHNHVWQAPLRGIGADMSLPQYLRVVMGKYLPVFRPEDARLAALLGALESLDAGTTTVFDWCNTTLSPEHTDAVIDGLRSAGIRAVLGASQDWPRVSTLTGRVTGGLAILGPEYGPWDDTVRELALARDSGLVASFHAIGGTGIIERMAAAGVLGSHVHVVHLNQVTEVEARLLAETRTGVTVTPVLEATMGHGRSAYSRLRAAGARPGLGTDVAVSTPPDLFEPVRQTLRDHRLENGELTPAHEFLAAATVDGARAIGLDQVGLLEVGKRADLILLSGLSHLIRAGATAIAGAVVATAGAGNVRTVMVDGQVVKRDGRLVNQRIEQLRSDAEELARRALSGAS